MTGEDTATVDFESVTAAMVIDTFLLFVDRGGPKIALVPFLEVTADMPSATRARVVRKMLTSPEPLSRRWLFASFYCTGGGMPIEGRRAGRERVVRLLTFWLRPAFALRVLNRFQRIAGFDRAVALASSALTALISLAAVSSAVLDRLGVKDVADPSSSRSRPLWRGAWPSCRTGDGDGRIRRPATRPLRWPAIPPAAQHEQRRDLG